MKNNRIKLAETDAEIAACFPVMQELRGDLLESEFVDTIKRLKRNGYHLAYLAESSVPVALAGFRFGESLAWKRYMYVDDLVTSSSERSKGHGAAMLAWLSEYAEREACMTFHLDSGVQRKEAHRFYEREGLQLPSYHFAKRIAPEE